MTTEASMNELDVARAIADGRLTSPQRYENVWLFAIRITGTGYAYRPKHDEFVFRPPAIYLNEEFLARCNGMTVAVKHPPKAVIENGEEYSELNVGSIFLPYIAGDEVWGVAKVYDKDAAEKMLAGELSTSPAVFFRDLSVNQKMTLENGAKLLIEGEPSFLDHVALCARGVWDKGEEPSGIRSDSAKEQTMTEEEMAAKKKADEEVEANKKNSALLQKISDGLGGLCKRMDAVEESEKKRAEADKVRKDKDDEEVRRRAGDPVQLAADEAKAKADAATLRKRIDEVAAMVKPIADDDHARLADEWARADEAFSVLGKQTPRPIPGETAPVFCRRVTRMLKEWSPRWKDVDLSTQAFPDDAGFAVIAEQIRADALAMGMSPATAPNGGLRMITRTVNGHIHNTFVGEPNAWMRQFAGTGRKVKSIGFRDSEGRWISQYLG